MIQPITTDSPAALASPRMVLSPAKVLQKIVTDKLSGRLTIGDPGDLSIAWRIYLGNGQIHFANSAIGQEERLTYLIRHYFPALEIHDGQSFASDYQALCYYWQSGHLSLQQFRKLLFLATQEALIQVLALSHAEIEFERTVGLDPLVLSVPLQQAIVPLRSLIAKWAQIRPQLSSPFQRPFISDPDQFIQHFEPKEPFLHPDQLSQALSQNHCLYEIATQARVELLQLALQLHPLIQAGVIGVHSFLAPQQDERPVVACIDDSKTVQRNVQRILETSGYQVVQLLEPTRALTTLVHHKPSLVLLDINMPDIDGYELCRLLRQTAQFKDTPIVMLTGREGLIDRIRARMVGATDYLTKPFTPQGLISLIQKLIDQTHLEAS